MYVMYLHDMYMTYACVHTYMTYIHDVRLTEVLCIVLAYSMHIPSVPISAVTYFGTPFQAKSTGMSSSVGSDRDIFSSSSSLLALSIIGPNTLCVAGGEHSCEDINVSAITLSPTLNLAEG